MATKTFYAGAALCAASLRNIASDSVYVRSAETREYRSDRQHHDGCITKIRMLNEQHKSGVFK